MTAIVISYRREDTQGTTGRIFDRLEGHYGQGHVFMDIDNIPFGTDFRHHLQETLDRCDILLVVVGPRWFGRNDAGQPRLLEEADWVRIEVATALAKKIPVIPLLVEGAKMPKPGELPDDLQGFAFRQAAVLDVGVDFRVHMERLTKSMDRILALKESPEPRAESNDVISFTEQKSPISRADVGLTDDRPPPANLKQTEVAEDHFDQPNVADRTPLAEPLISNTRLVAEDPPPPVVSKAVVPSLDAREDEKEIDRRQPTLAIANELPIQSEVPQVEKPLLRVDYPKIKTYQKVLLLILAAYLCSAIVYLHILAPKSATLSQAEPTTSPVPAATPQAIPTPASIPGCDVFPTTVGRYGKSVALFIDDVPKGINAAWPARDIINANGWKIVAEFRIPPKTSDYSSYLWQIESADFIVFCGSSSAMAQQGRKLGTIR